ncbi:hypothetical protein AB0E55_29100, partial [Amycolatopsis keratiniphila]|uniref:hypothetical protein n=1 Tax=Amycolatopsis keratiniphila TaxID=129921 RepID=UPI0033C1923F
GPNPVLGLGLLCSKPESPLTTTCTEWTLALSPHLRRFFTGKTAAADSGASHPLVGVALAGAE